MGTFGRVPRLVAETVVGWVLITAGVVMLVTPGPGLVALLAGLAVLARHYRWAEWVKERALAQVHGTATQVRAHRAARRAGTDVDAAHDGIAAEHLEGADAASERGASPPTAA